MESLIYLIISLQNKCVLPWSNEKGTACLRMKEMYIPESDYLYEIIKYVQNLDNKDSIDYDIIKMSIKRVTNRTQNRSIPFEYNISNTSERVVNLILGTSGLSNNWAGISN